MLRGEWRSSLLIAVLLLLVGMGGGVSHADVAYKVDHTDVDLFNSIPDQYLNLVKQMRIHSTGESHSRQMTHGLELLEAANSKYSVQIDTNLGNLTESGALKVLTSYWYVEYPQWTTYGAGDEKYWSTPTGRAYSVATAYQAAQQGKPLAISLWNWCWDMSVDGLVHDESGATTVFTDDRRDAYLSSILAFNNNASTDPTIFLYNTSVTDAAVAEGGWRVTHYNDDIRAAASANNGILFDQADIENWSNDNTQRRTDTWDSHTLYLRHGDYAETVGTAYPDGHTNDALCIRKAKALWVLLAKMNGWDGGSTPASSISVTAPNGSENWNAGSTHSITWTSSNVTTVNISYSTNNGSSWTAVASGVSAAAQTYSWTVPNTASAQCLVKITSTADGNVYDVSNAVFTITGISVVVTAPNGGENWNAGSTHSITWTSSNVTTVNISYSTNNGSSWTAVASNVSAAAQTYSWTVPNTASAQCLVKITSTADGNVYDVSNAVFTITGISVVVTAPNGSESWKNGSSHSITWTYSNVATVNITYSTNNGSSWTAVASGVNAAAQTYSWTVPNTVSNQCLVKITSAADSSVTDVSNAVFSIVPLVLWGDVDNNQDVDIADALKIATYDIDSLNTGLTSILSYITQRADVNADSNINSTDALICATYDVYPANPYNPARIGNELGSVPKSLVTESTAVIPGLSLTPEGSNRVLVDALVSTAGASQLIGSATVTLTWNPDSLTYISSENAAGNIILSTRDAASGKISYTRFDTNGQTVMEFPALTFERKAPNAKVSFKLAVECAAVAQTFEALTLSNNSVDVILGVEETTPVQFELSQNVPNPFNPSTTIHFSLSEAGTVLLKVYNIQGQRVATLVDDYLPAGTHSILWNAVSDQNEPLSSGVYIYQLRAGGMTGQKQMLLVR
jgi:hypothetical protein